MTFKSGSKIKVGNVVLEALQSQIIRDYISATEDHNLTATSQGRINIFSSITYRRWLKVAKLKALGKVISNIFQAVRWTKSKALAGLDGYTAAGYIFTTPFYQSHILWFRFDALDSILSIIGELKTDDKTKSDLNDRITVKYSTIKP